MIDRREFGRLLGGAALAAANPALIGATFAKGGAKVVIVGGGAGGGTVGRILKTEAPDLEITVVEARPTYTSCFNSNHYFGGFRTFASLQHSYDGLKKLGIKVVNDTATAIDAGKKSVTLAGGQALPYDRLVLSPGIDFNYGAIEGYSAAASEIMPHAWKAGPQTLLLMQQLEAMDDGGVVVMTVPGNPYRCPPGPYERACMIAHYLKTHKPKSKLVIFDAKPTFSKQGAFEEAFEKYYHGIIDLNLTNEIDNFEVVRVDTKSMEVETKSGIKLKGAVVNVIPPQTAGDIAIAAGCAEGAWCPIKPQNFASALVEGVYVIGDAAIAADMPKSAYSASSEGRVVAAGILADLAGAEPAVARYRNTCWSLLAADDSIKIGADYTPGEKDGKPVLAPSGPFVSQKGESAEVRRKNYAESLAWYHAIISDAFNDNAALTHKG
ncbi:MAG TPA: NAD(P)/FAD-dependent oxidoreductase [Hyphomicrobium sp.]|jgi:NADPH-dependent 2,4-dienoyl-CoA reductase/sulfur reductase-like enzyme